MIELDGFDDLVPIGSGGFSTVYRARQLGFGRTVAVKVLEGGLGNESQRASFEREVKAMGVVSQHPHIVTVFTSTYSSGGRPCIVMEYFQRGTLAERIEDIGALELDEVLDIGVKLASALQTAHDRGILHQDVKPQNIFLSEFGQPALGDFGISSIMDDRPAESGGLTLHYASPERISKQPATPSSDLYSLAATLYRAVAGRRPFDHRDLEVQQTAQELARRVLDTPAPRLDPGAVPPLVQDALIRALAKRPSDRHRSALEFAQHLRAVQRELRLDSTPLVLEGAKPDTIDFDLGNADVERGPDPRIGSQDATTAEGVAPSPVATNQSSRQRRALAMFLGILALAALAAGLVRALDTSPAPETSPPVPVDLPKALSPPYEVELSRSPDGTVSASWKNDDTDATYEVLRVGALGGGPEQLVETSAFEAELPAIEDTTVCIQVRAITDQGRISDVSDIVCLEE